MSHMGLPAHSIKIKTHAQLIERSQSINLTPDRFTVRHLSGIAATPLWNLDLDFTDSISKPIGLFDIAPAIGEWTAVASNGPESETESEFVICNDEFGYSPIFYSHIPGKEVIFSDSFQAVAYELMRTGISPSLDLDAYITTVSTKDARFANPLAFQTSAAEIRLLPPHHALYVSADSAVIFDRAQLLDLQNLDTSALVKKGVDYISKTLKLLAENKEHSHSLLLSGGVDSRVVLGLVLGANAEDKFAIRSNDPRNYKSKYSYRVFEDDFFISYAVGQNFGLNWLRPRSASNIKTSLEEGLKLSQAYSSNFSNAYPATDHHSIYSKPEMSLRGGGGEPIKGAGFLSLAKQVQEFNSELGDSSDSPFAQFKNWFVNNAVIEVPDKESISSALNILEPWLSTENFDQLMPSYYQHSRNRTHFGHAKFSSTSNLYPFQPLSNSYFFAATKMLGHAELRNYAIAKQIFNATDPTLLEFPFEDPEATKLLTQSAPRFIGKNQSVLETHFKEVSRPKPKIQEIRFPGTIHQEPLKNKNAALISLCRTVAIDIEERFSSDREQLKIVHKAVFRALEKGILNPSTTAARMMSARDVFSPTSAPGSTITYSAVENGPSPISIRGHRSNDAHPSIKTQTIDVRPPIVLSPEINRTNRGIQVDANPASQRPANLEFAFYLLSNGKAVQRIQYADSQTTEFILNNEEKLSRVSVRCYARHCGTIAPCAIETVSF